MLKQLYTSSFKMKLEKITYLGYVWNYLDQGQICNLQTITALGLKEDNLLIFKGLAYQFLEGAYRVLLLNHTVM